MSVPSSMVHRSVDGLVVRSLFDPPAQSSPQQHPVSSDGDAADGDVDGGVATAADDADADDAAAGLPDCKVKRNYTCSACDFFTQNPRQYLYHLRDRHNEKVKIYECPSCLYASRHFQKLLRHNKMVHGSSEALEKARRRSQQDMEQPEDSEDGSEDHPLDPNAPSPAVFKCSVCDFTTKYQATLSKHESEQHFKTKFFRCGKCTYVTHIKARYTKHVKYHSMPMIKCDMCDFRTPYKWNLDRHCKNHNGNGTFRCSACNFTADIKQSLTVHEMNHHVPPVGQVASGSVGSGGRRRNKVGASDATAAEEAAAAAAAVAHEALGGADGADDELTINEEGQQQSSAQALAALKSEPIQAAERRTPKPQRPPSSSVAAVKKLKSGTASPTECSQSFGGSDFIHPDDILHHSNGKVYIKIKCKLCNFKSAWDSEMAKHERRVHNIDRENHKPVIKKPPRPIPNLIPIPTTAIKHNQKADAPEYPVLKTVEIPEPSEPAMSQKDINDICAKSTNSVLKDFASLFGSEDVFKTFASPKVPDLIPYTGMQSPKGKLVDVFKQKNASFFDSLREKLELGSSCNLTCGNCGHESKCLTEHAKHQKICGKEADRRPSVVTVHNISSSRCQFCRQRCKSSTDLYNHLQICTEAMKSQNLIPKDEDDSEHELKIDEEQYNEEPESKPHPMENKVFVWNDIMVPMDIEVDDSIYEYTEDKVDDNVSLDLSTRTQSPMDSENSFAGGQEVTQPSGVRHSPLPTNEKIPTHGNDISVAQHKRVFKCPHCTFWASTASRFHVHIVGHLNKKPFECSLCAYRSNWRWDITKHIKLKSVRDPAHESAKVLMTDETGRRNYTKYNKYLTEIPISSEQSMDTSGGCGTRPKHHQQHDRSPSTSGGRMVDLTRLGPPTMVPVTADSAAYLANIADKKRGGGAADNKKTLFKCKKCNFKDASRDVLLQHVKGHYQHQPGTTTPTHPAASMTSSSMAADASSPSGSCSVSGTIGAATNEDCSPQDLRIRGTSPDRDEASVNNIAGKGGCSTAGYAPFRCGHCNQVSNWKHVIQRHCRLKHSGDVRVVSNKNGQERLEVEETACEDTSEQSDVAQSKPFRCTLCPFSTDTGEELKAHLFGHVDGGRHRCFYCRYSVSHRDDLLAHLKLHGVADPDDFLAKVSDKNPLLDSADGKKFKCLTCPYVTNSKSQFTYHKQFHKPRGGQYTCTHCSYNVSKRHLLHQHLKVHGISVTSHKQNGEALYLDDVSDEIEEIPQSATLNVDLQNFPDIPLVWVSKSGKFSKMFKCRYCPHVNLRKVNIQEHEKMHSAREKSCSSSRNGDSEHRCTECNYMCNNAGVLSSHSKVHQGLYGTVHRLVDPTRTDEEQIRELSRSLGIQPSSETSAMDDIDLIESSPNEDEIDSSSGSGSVLYFCKECPARFLKENEFGIHKRFHGSKLFYKCDYCSYTSREKPHLYSHYKVHTSEYQERTKVLQSMYITSTNYPQSIVVTKNFNGESAWVVSDTKSEMSTLCSILNKPLKSSQMVPLSGTDLFLQKSEAEPKQVAELSREASPLLDEDFYASNLKNGKVKEKRYKCQKCPSAFDKKDQYKVHSNLHGAKQRYICDYCDYSVKYFANYIQHLKKHRMNAEALTSRRPSDEMDIEPDEAIEVTSDVDIKPKISVADRQVETILEQRQMSQPKEVEEKRVYWCQNCPYTNPNKAAVSSHNKRHVSVSGVRNAYTCEHCDYSVPQNHFLREHTKLHFTTSKAKQVEGFMNCDNVKLTSVKVEQGEQDEEVFFEEHASKVESDRKEFSPPLNVEVEERFNNNEGERRYVNVQTGELVVKQNSDKQSEGGGHEYKMDII